MPEQMQSGSVFKKRRFGGPAGQLQAQTPGVGFDLSQSQSGIAFAGPAPGQPAGQQQAMPLVAPNGALQAPSGMPVGWMPPGMPQAQPGQQMLGAQMRGTTFAGGRAPGMPPGQLAQQPLIVPGTMFSPAESSIMAAPNPVPGPPRRMKRPDRKASSWY